MAKRSRKDPKADALRARGSLNPLPEGVTDEAFAHGGFFDARDQVQVRYEMVCDLWGFCGAEGAEVGCSPLLPRCDRLAKPMPSSVKPAYHL